MSEDMSDGLLYLCRCEEVTREEIEAAIDDGAKTLNEVKRRTRAGMGLCQGRTCGRVIARVIARRSGRPLSDVLPASARSPMRPVKFEVFQGDESDDPD